MGNSLTCLPKKGARGASRTGSKRSQRSGRNTASEEEMIHRQALAMILQQNQLSQRFDGSMSRRIGSTSSRRKNLSESATNGKLTAELIGNMETKKFVLVHGEGFGAWCWYKIISLLEEAGLQPVAVDLKGSGIDHTDPNSVTTMAEYAKPLLDYLQNLPGDEKVILVGHSFGGACVSHAMECFPEKISKAVFVAATMVSDGQRPFDVFSQELGGTEMFLKESQLVSYGNGGDRSPTSFALDKQHVKALYLNNTPPKDMALAAAAMRAVPLRPMMERVVLTGHRYGKVRRYFVQTMEDRVLSPDTQERLVRVSPPQGVYKIKAADHCPFFSKPQALHKILLEIALLT
ncbi:putative methylesterase 14, chloroplastic [Wolffia australiana]